jgi:ATP-dependent RNA helicase RhlE
MPFTKLGLSDQLVQGILATGYTAPTAIQLRAIPLGLEGKDIIGCAQTGTGKTAAFVLPILNHLMKHHVQRHGPTVRALVLVPTRELAQQAEDFVTQYGRFMPLRTLSVYGGANMQNQIKRFARGVDIAIATPGRLLDHINRKTVDLSHVEILVLDEADRMFDMGFIHDVRTIIGRVPSKRQTMLFSATMSPEVRALVASVQKNPEFIEIGEQRKPVDSVKQHFYKVAREAKLPLLLHILADKQLTSVLVFARTKHGADKITRRLERNQFRAVAIHSNRTQAQRERALGGFKNGQYAVLVATDIAARGIDVDGISHVVNFDTPSFAEDYIHRIGRTGRAEKTGDAITFVSSDEVKNFKKIGQFTGKTFTLGEYPGFDASTIAAQAKAEPPAAEHHRPERPHHGERQQRTGRPQSHERRPRPDNQLQHARTGIRPSPQRTGRPPSNERRPHPDNQQQHARPGQQRTERPHSDERRPRPDNQQSHTRPDQRHQRPQGHGRPQSPGQQRRPYGQQYKPYEQGEKVRPPRPKRGVQGIPPAHASTGPIVKNDWQRLLSLAEEKGTLRKKLRKLFKGGE